MSANISLSEAQELGRWFRRINWVSEYGPKGQTLLKQIKPPINKETEHVIVSDDTYNGGSNVMRAVYINQSDNPDPSIQTLIRPARVIITNWRLIIFDFNSMTIIQTPFKDLTAVRWSNPTGWEKKATATFVAHDGKQVTIQIQIWAPGCFGAIVGFNPEARDTVLADRDRAAEFSSHLTELFTAIRETVN